LTAYSAHHRRDSLTGGQITVGSINYFTNTLDTEDSWE